jgi:hypothetical protein
MMRMTVFNSRNRLTACTIHTLWYSQWNGATLWTVQAGRWFWWR